jgi:catechol 2,3-dioxygenase-like lactoylglutathione lyase family enzyme
MADPNFIILYVDNPPASAEFYAELLGKPAVESSPTFAMFALPSGVMIGLWSRHTVEPAASADVGGGSEVAFAVESRNQVTALFNTWTSRGLRVAQKPVDMDFGHTFVALDPDGHRLRVFATAA